MGAQKDVHFLGILAFLQAVSWIAIVIPSPISHSLKSSYISSLGTLVLQ
ncbi:hypothetical protein CsSME_00045455 [Camellia sinensis var. sinensis]